MSPVQCGEAGEKQKIKNGTAEKALSTQGLGTEQELSSEERGHDIPGGSNSKSKGTAKRQHRGFSDLKGFYDSSTGQHILRRGFLCPDCSANGVPERRDYWGLKLSGQFPWRGKVQRWARKEEHIIVRGEEGRWTSICKCACTHTSASYAFKP